MKKLFFAALVATVAVGGAFAQQNVYRSGQTTGRAGVCSFLPTATCTSTIGTSQLYLNPGAAGSQGSAINPSQWNFVSL